MSTDLAGWRFIDCNPFGTHSAYDVLKNILTNLNTLTAEQRASAKVAASDATGDAAAGVILYYTGPGAPGAGGVLDTGTLDEAKTKKWKIRHFTKGEPSEMYQGFATFLDSRGLEQGLAARLAMTNFHDGDAQGAVFYPPPESSTDQG